MGEVNDIDGIEEITTETAFVDMYGDFEELVQARRDHYIENRATIMQVARAQSIKDFANRQKAEYTIAASDYFLPEDEKRMMKSD